ncbi:ATP-dependent nuclease [Pseudomonas sp. GM80]|uniref:ATP-dependent nuclease n=1 Tax=Pseudomonas sp. GM80 TaxID=1144339 RepID=UPI00026F4E4F|nr:AAA family ATPase [Pseudomonas sp. GM80]EJN34421.1 putative ATP-dependent endonuclease of the OLD family [Pseudomonas sp. GM80]
MRISRVVIQNLRSLQSVDVLLTDATTLVIGENNTGKSAFIHALRLCLDVGLSSSYRALLKDDIHSSIIQSFPFQVFVGIEFSGFEGNENEEALLHGTQIGPDRARIFYRFRPKKKFRELHSIGHLTNALTLEDFGWELFGGGNSAVDLTAISWNVENADFGATPVGLQYLQSYLVVFLPALRDVEAELQQNRRSLLTRLIESCGISDAEQQALINAVMAANAQIEASPTIQAVAEAIDNSLKSITGPAFSLDVDLGLSSPTFQAIVRNLIVLLSSSTFSQFEPRRNGLGLNNILYIAILIEHFRKRAAGGKSSGELILIEEPEAHLHPQMQATLVEALRELPFQVIATTHSTQVTSKAPLSSLVMFTHKPGLPPYVGTVRSIPALTPYDQLDLERYLDSTKSNLLFARRVMLVEGAAELLLLPPLIKQVLKIDLEREGITLVAIHGVHFGAFARLFSVGGLPKRCAIVADADLVPELLFPGDDPVINIHLSALHGPYVHSFAGATTFEREITLPGNLEMLAETIRDLGAPQALGAIEGQILVGGPIPDALKAQILRTAKRFGKARFAQTAARHAHLAGELPAYVIRAVEWLREI